MGGEEDDASRWNKENPWQSPGRPYRENPGEMKLWGVFLFGFICATATTLALRAQASSNGKTGTTFWTAFQEEAWKRYNRRLQEKYEEEMERVERIRHMQSVFNRERNKYRRGYESWRENDLGAYHQHFQRNDWNWKTNASFKDNESNFRRKPRDGTNYPLSHHYLVLGLDRSRVTPYTDDEIKTAFRAKAKEFHPDQNQDNKEAAEAKFKEVMMSYEAIKQERKNMT
uniref:Uncharacterized protein LOC8265248 isoform X2 n=1 Tax=Rhizophora mucronata TaxID=61149 RepID=A0A2P2JTD1_RHIMU